MWLPGFEQVTFNHSLGGNFDRPARAVCWHTTEGSTAQGAFSVYATKLACPHFTVDPITHARYQHVPLEASSYSLERGDRQHICTVQTNRSGIIQIETVGFAQEAWDWPQDRLEWLGTEVLAPILDACPTIPRNAVYSGQRMDEPQWDAWSGGQCGHRDVCCQPSGHWDPGELDLTQILAYANGDDMALSDEDIHKISEAVWSRVLDIEGQKASAANWIGFMYAEITRTEAQGGKLMKNIGDVIEDKAILADGT